VRGAKRRGAGLETGGPSRRAIPAPEPHAEAGTTVSRWRRNMRGAKRRACRS